MNGALCAWNNETVRVAGGFTAGYPKKSEVSQIN